MALRAETVDAMAKRYLELQDELSRLRKSLIEEVEAAGEAPEKALKTKQLFGDEYELRVTRGMGVAVNAAMAKRIGRRFGAKAFARVFKIVEKLAVADGAQKFLDGEKLPAGFRAAFAKAVKMRPRAPKLEIREREKGKPACRTGRREAA